MAADCVCGEVKEHPFSGMSQEERGLSGEVAKALQSSLAWLPEVRALPDPGFSVCSVTPAGQQNTGQQSVLQSM